jgi:hypothetical protein
MYCSEEKVKIDPDATTEPAQSACTEQPADEYEYASGG